MTQKPSEREEEYFVRMEFERRKKNEMERQKMLAVEERERRAEAAQHRERRQEQRPIELRGPHGGPRGVFIRLKHAIASRDAKAADRKRSMIPLLCSLLLRSSLFSRVDGEQRRGIILPRNSRRTSPRILESDEL